MRSYRRTYRGRCHVCNRPGTHGSGCECRPAAYNALVRSCTALDCQLALRCERALRCFLYAGNVLGHTRAPTNPRWVRVGSADLLVIPLVKTRCAGHMGLTGQSLNPCKANELVKIKLQLARPRQHIQDLHWSLPHIWRTTHSRRFICSFEYCVYAWLVRHDAI